ncbi:MAG: phospho-sugar mutase [Ruminococcaceae bacterium]|nr:phospho-sugar mutase [Oscillospiraceae bacterium]
MTAFEQYNKWLNFPELDASLKAELLGIQGNDEEIKERFSTSLEFGTGGLRGIIRAGTNGMNVYTVCQATQGLANLIVKNGKEAMDKGVAIGYDSRHFSDTFAKESAMVLVANGIKVYLFPSLRPTPMLSFAIREMNTTAGIVITASHNPAKYNGYKAYWSDGGQLPPEEADVVYQEMKQVDIFSGVKKMPFDDAMAQGLIEWMPESVDEAYYKAVMNLSVNPDALKDTDLKVVYTPFHGSGNIPVREVLGRMGLKNLTVVKEQELPDGAFPTVKSPNPEESDGFKIALEYAKKEDADIIIGTDPDSDRVGVLLKTADEDYEILNGNQIGVLIVNYILDGLKKQNKLPQNGAVIKTIVTTNMIYEFQKDYPIEVINVYTGFKFIGEQIKIFEETGKHTYLFGFEESFGFLSGTHARDKDAVNACMLLCEAAAYYKKQGKTLKDVQIDLYEKYGYYREGLVSITHEGMAGIEKIKSLMAGLRANVPTEFAGVKTVLANDYSVATTKNLLTGEETALAFPPSNVLSYELEDGTLISFRPSGTEPKIKAYIMTKGKTEAEALEKRAAFDTAIREVLK